MSNQEETQPAPFRTGSLPPDLPPAHPPQSAPVDIMSEVRPVQRPASAGPVPIRHAASPATADDATSGKEKVDPREGNPREVPITGFWPKTRDEIVRAFRPYAPWPKLTPAEQAIVDERERLAEQERQYQAEQNRIREREAWKIHIREAAIHRLKEELAEEVTGLTVVFIGVKGAAATTTTVANASSVAANNIRANLIASDLNPAQGTLAARLGKDYNQTITLRELRENLDDLAAFRAFIRKVRPTKYSVRPISADDIVSGEQHLTAEESARMLDVINANTEYHYIDTANDITHPAVLEAVKRADVLVFTAFTGIHDSLRHIASGMETLRQHGFRAKVDRAVVVISGLTSDDRIEDYHKYINRVNIRDEVIQHFEFHGPFLGIPYDETIRRDTEVDLEALNWETYQAYLELNIAIFEQAPQLHAGENRHDS